MPSIEFHRFLVLAGAVMLYKCGYSMRDAANISQGWIMEGKSLWPSQ